MDNWIFNSGYQNFRNPFPAPPVMNSAGTTIISYTRPITVAAANFLLGYHYLVLGHLEQALVLFEHSAKLEPTYTVPAP